MQTIQVGKHRLQHDLSSTYLLCPQKCRSYCYYSRCDPVEKLSVVDIFPSCENPLEDINPSSLDELAAESRSSLKSPKTTVGVA